MGTEDNGVGQRIGSSNMNSKLGSALSCVQVTVWATPAVHSLMRKLLIQRGMDPTQSERVLETRELEWACLAAHVPTITQMWDTLQGARTSPLPVRAWTCLAGTGLELERESRDLGSGSVGCSRRQQGRHLRQPLGCTGAGRGAGSSRGRVCHASLLLPWLWLAPAWGFGSSLLPQILCQWGVQSSATGLKSLTSSWGPFVLWKTGWRRVSPQKPLVQHKRDWKAGSSHTAGDVTVLGYRQGG